jgi:group I intron endonuclease
MGYIYSITNNINNKLYIGLTTEANPYKRWKRHIYESKNPVYRIHKAMNKYGTENFKFRVLEECDDNKVKEREIHYIEKFNSFHKGYNCTLGGDLSYNWGKGITQYTKQGEVIDHFISLSDASKSVNGDEKGSAISRCVNGERFSAYGYRWSWKNETLPTYKTGYYMTPLYAYTLNGLYKEWESKELARKDIKCKDRRSIHQSIVSPINNKKQCKGWYFFEMKDNEEKVDYSDITFARRYKPSSKKAREMALKARGIT